MVDMAEQQQWQWQEPGTGFRDYFKPADYLFDACAEGRLLILSPWPYDGTKRHISLQIA